MYNIYDNFLLILILKEDIRMSKIAVVTDSNSGITPEQADTLGTYLVPMPVIIDDKTYFEGVDISREDFYDKLSNGCNITTSQPLPGDIGKLWDELLLTYDEIIYIPMSSALSRSYETAVLLSKEYDAKVHIINNQRISVSQRQSVLDAIEMVNANMKSLDIKEALEDDKYNSSIYIIIDTLEYLKKGGRLTPTVATIGTLLRIKPVLQIQGGLLDSFAKARTMNIAKNIMIKQLRDDAINRFNSEENEVILRIAHTCNAKEIESFKEELQAAFPEHTIQADYLPLSIASHVGPGAIGVGCIKKLNRKSLYHDREISQSSVI